MLELTPATAAKPVEHDRWQRWRLDEATETLRFFLGPVDPTPVYRAQCVRLSNGDVLAVYRVSREYEHALWFLQLRQAGDGWVPHAVGVTGGCCVGLWWSEGLRGRVLLDTRDPSEFRCSMELRGSKLGSMDKRLDARFLLDPREDSASLRNRLSGWRDGGLPLD